MAILLQPGETAIYDILIPHQPLPGARAAKLAKLDFEAHLNACRAFWRAKLAAGASIHVPERAIDERIQAGLLHCDIAALGKEPNGTVLATIGWYAPIGSESAPIIQFFDSMAGIGWPSARCNFFSTARKGMDSSRTSPGINWKPGRPSGAWANITATPATPPG